MQNIIDSICVEKSQHLSACEQQSVQDAKAAAYAVMRQCLHFEEDTCGQSPCEGTQSDYASAQEVELEEELVRLQKYAEELTQQVKQLREDVPTQLREMQVGQHATKSVPTEVQVPPEFYKTSDSCAEAALCVDEYEESMRNELALKQVEALERLREDAAHTLTVRLNAAQKDIPEATARLQSFVDVLNAGEKRKRGPTARKSLLPELTPER